MDQWPGTDPHWSGKIKLTRGDLQYMKRGCLCWQAACEPSAKQGLFQSMKWGSPLALHSYRPAQHDTHTTRLHAHFLSPNTPRTSRETIGAMVSPRIQNGRLMPHSPNRWRTRLRKRRWTQVRVDGQTFVWGQHWETTMEMWSNESQYESYLYHWMCCRASNGNSPIVTHL